jgi:hypothetical protein
MNFFESVRENSPYFSGLSLGEGSSSRKKEESSRGQTEVLVKANAGTIAGLRKYFRN